MSKKQENVNTSIAYVPCGIEEADVSISSLEKIDTSCGKTYIGQYLKRITLPAQLKPIAFRDTGLNVGDKILVWDTIKNCWLSWFYSPGDEISYPHFSHYIPQDALPVPVEEKSLADELEYFAEFNLMAAPELSDLLRRAAKELRK
jgi:hypothetical protein